MRQMLYVFFLLCVCTVDAFEKQFDRLPTYFKYTEQELAPLAPLQSTRQMTQSELSRWDRASLDLIYQEKAEEDAARITAYLYVAQREAAYLSYRLKHCFAGSLDPISKKALGLFFPFLSARQLPEEDPYSNMLAEIVLAKLKARLDEENHRTRFYDRKTGEEYWSGKSPYVGFSTASWKPWIIKSAHQFRLPPPPSLNDPFWKEQIQAVKEAVRSITAEQRRAVYVWAGIGKGALQTGNWVKIANEYMWNQNVEFSSLLFIRSILAMGIEDSTLAAFDSKYTYWIKRPHMMDGSIRPLIPVPNHPTYPSAHSVISATSAAILTYFFPQARTLWMDLAKEGGGSRIWGGIHFPIDNEAGFILGERVGEAVIESVSVQDEKILHGLKPK